jgi:hypothetical protein
MGLVPMAATRAPVGTMHGDELVNDMPTMPCCSARMAQ